MKDPEQINLQQNEGQVSDELNTEDLESVAGGGPLTAIGFGLIGAGVGLAAGAISGKSVRESLGDALNAGAAGAIAGAFVGP